MYNDLRAFYAEHGHTDVPSEQRELRIFVRTHRKLWQKCSADQNEYNSLDEISKQRFKELADIDFWDERGSDT